MAKKRNTAKTKHLILGIAIALLSVFFFSYAIQSVYPGPEYNDYCPKDHTPLNSQTSCEEVGGRWTENAEYIEDSEARLPTFKGWCDNHYTCRKDYDAIREPYERNVFFANLIIGIIVLAGSFFLAIEAVSSGLMGGSVLLIFYGTMRYWGNLSDIWRTVFLGISLIVLISLAYKKLKD